MSRLDEYFAKANRGSQTTSSVSASGEKPASNMDAYFAKAGKPVRTNPLNLYTEALKASQGQSTMQTPYADAAAQTKQSGTQNLYAQAAGNAKKGRNAAKGTSAIFNSVYGKADDRASSAGSGKYANILKASDYTELSKSGESKRKLFGDARYDYINNIKNFRAQSDVQQAQGRGQDYGKYAFMTDDEIGVYNYLYATQGKKAANAYLSDLDPELDKQWYTGTNRATTEALGKNAATRTLASAMTVAAQPARTITSMIAMADDAVRTAKGQEINPYSKWRQASNITQELRADTSQHIEETNPGMGGKVGSFVYNTAMSAADSAMNALVAKGFGEAVGLTGDTLMKATNILGSALMSSEAASLSIAESKEKGYSNAGALALGLTRGAIEYASEAVGGEWVIRKIKANPLSFVKSMALTMIPEGVEEVMSDAANGVVNLAIDAAFGTEESGIPKMLKYYRTSGTDWQKKHAELATVLAVLGQEGLSFLGGALATLGSSSVQYGTNRANINQTAERLDTTPKNVVQMMQDAQTENPGVIYALAELTDAENADDLRQKIGTKEDMKRAAEYLTKQMEAGGRFGAQEGTYTVEAQNAPMGAQRAQNEGISTTPAAAIDIQEGMNNGQSTYQGRENGSYDLRTGGQAAAEGGTQALAGGRAEIPGGVGADAQADLRQVTPAQLGIRNGGTEAVTVVDAQRLGGEAKSAYDTVARRGMEPIAIRGAIRVGNGYANAYTESGKVYFRVDAVDSAGNAISPEALVRHELFHNYISEEALKASAEVIRESMTAEEYDGMYEAYRDAYASIYDFETMSVEEIERILREEIAADAYAGLNWFSGDAPVQEAVRAETERNAPAQRAEAQQQRTGPPEGRGAIVVLPDGKKYVQADRQVIFGNDPDSWADQIEGYINRKIRNGEDVILTTDSGDVLKITKDTAGKASFRNYVTDESGHRRPMTDSEYETKLNAEAHIDELAKVSERVNKNARPDETSTDGRPIHGRFAENGWLYREAWFQDFDGQYYRVTISIADGDRGVVVYNVGEMRKRTSPARKRGSSDSVTETGAQQGKSSSMATIRQTEGNSQEKSSGKASVEVENRDSDNKKRGRKKLSEAEKYQNTTVKKSETRTVRNTAEYEKQISRMEKRLETGGQATLNEGGGNFYRANIREENGEYYAYVSDGKNVVAKHRSKSKMEAIRWTGDRVRAEIASRILYNPDTELRGGYQSDLKSAENREYPVFKTKSGTEVQTVPFWTWVQDKAGHYGLVVGNDVNGAVRAWFPFGGDGNGTVVSAPNTTLYAVEGDYESRAWNNDIVADVLNDAEESAAARNAREERLRESRETDQQRLDRLTKKDDTLHQINRENGRPAPNKGSGEVYRELMSKGKSEVLTPISMDNPRTLSFKITLDTNVLGVATATVMHNGHQIYKETGPIKEYVARDVAEFVDVQANKNFSQENFERAKQLEAEKTGDEDARIAELFGDSEELAKQELTDKTVKNLTEKGQADKAEEYAARATIAGTTEKVIPEVLKEERNYREEIEKITSGAMRMFVNAGDTVRRIAKATKSKSLEGYYFNAGAYSQRAGNWIAKGGARTDIDGHKTGASLADTLAPMRKDTAKYRDFQLYLLHMHNVDRMKYDNSAELERIKDELKRVKDRYPQLRELSAQELARVASDAADDPISREEAHEMYIEAHQGKNPPIGTVNMAAAYIQELQKQRAIVEKQGLKPVFGYDVTADDSQTAAMLLAAENPEFKEWAKEVYKYSDDLIRYRVEAGLITREFADALKKRYPHYIPTFREEGTNSRKARSARRNGGIVVSNAIGRAVGSDGVLLPLHTALSRKTVSTMRNAGLNQFGLALVHEYDGNKKATEKYIWNVAESEYTPTEAAIESDEDYKPVFQNIFSVKENGKTYDITMDEGLTAAMKAFEPDKLASYGTAKAMKKLNDLFKALCTGYNPFFMIRNGVRDWQDAGFYSTDWKTWEKMYWSAWNQIRKNGEIWQQYKALGGSYASMLDYTTGMVKEPKNALGKAAARYESLGQAIEAAPRLAEFMTILANKGGSKTVDGVKTGQFTQSDLMEAMLGAADITTNFARGGSVTKALNRYLVPFLNPSVQGFDKFIRNATETRSVKAAGSLILKAALMGIAPALLNALAYRDDDEWDDIPANTKANYYLINAGKWLGDGYWIKIPKGRAIAVLSTAAVYGKEKLDGEDVKFSDVFEVIKSNIAPTDIFNQNIATAWTQAKLTNPDNPGTTWYGGNIESDRLQNYRPGERYDEKTDELSKWLGKTFNLSPKKINYLLDQYSGVIGDILLPLMTPATSAKSKLLAAPMAAFTIDTTSTNKTTGEYYDLLDELKYDTNDGDIGAGITRKYVSHAGDEVNDYYQQIRAIQNDKNLSDGEKNRLVRALKAQLIERQKEIIAQAEPYREAVNDYLKAHPELSTDNDAAITEYAEQYEITEDQAESRMDAIVYREANREVFGAEYALRTYNADVYDKARAAYAKGVSYETYYDYYFATKEMHADKDENGKSISGSKKAKVVEYIDSLDIPPEQKDALYVAAGYTEKSARYQKWNGGSGGSGGRRGSGKRTTLKAPAPKAGKIVIPRSGTASSAKAGGTSKTPKVSGNVIADFTKTASGTDIQKAVTQAKRKALKAGNRTVYVEEGSPIDYFLKYGKLPSLK
nr:MAG TPA: Large polyvalent protein associated domain 38 [Caudoviricetes sp.]